MRGIGGVLEDDVFYNLFELAYKIFVRVAKFCAPFVMFSPLVVLWDAAVWAIGSDSAFDTELIPLRLILYAAAAFVLFIFVRGSSDGRLNPWENLRYTSRIGDDFTRREFTLFNRFADPIRQESFLLLTVWFVVFYLTAHPVIVWYSAGLLYTEHKSCVQAVAGPNAKAVRTSVFFLRDKTGEHVLVSKARGGFVGGEHSNYGCLKGAGYAMIRGPYFKASDESFAPHPYRDVTALLGYPKNIPLGKLVGGDVPPLPEGINE